MNYKKALQTKSHFYFEYIPSELIASICVYLNLEDVGTLRNSSVIPYKFFDSLNFWIPYFNFYDLPVLYKWKSFDNWKLDFKKILIASWKTKGVMDSTSKHFFYYKKLRGIHEIFVKYLNKDLVNSIWSNYPFTTLVYNQSPLSLEVTTFKGPVQITT